MNPTAMPFCCHAMQEHLERGDLHLYYDPKLREYGIRYADDNVSIQAIHYCPWCGTQLPDSLRDAWFEELERLGLEPEDDLPERLRDDRWWRDLAKPSSNAQH